MPEVIGSLVLLWFVFQLARQLRSSRTAIRFEGPTSRLGHQLKDPAVTGGKLNRLIQ
jgi:hypothetical protein